MKMFFYRGKHENFGDELNHWLWPQILPDFFDDEDSDLFLGIGSILYDNFDKNIRKIVFGSGYGGYTTPPEIDEKWQFYFVRGKTTAKILGIDESLAIGDSGILIRSVWDAKNIEKRYPASFIPHYESAMYGAWDKICEAAGINYIDPRNPVDDVLNAISASELVISEAMHGVIISDALRVPWRAIRPLAPANRAKWYDWASALNVEIDFDVLPASNFVEAAAALRQDNRWRKAITFRHRRIRQLTGDFAFGSAARALKAVGAKPGQLSSNTAIEAAHDKMLSQVEKLKADFATTGSLTSPTKG